MKELYCFSALGNSADIARQLSELLPPEFADPVWVFPVYAWGVPPIVVKHIQNLDLSGKLVHMVCTCGSETGHIDRQWRRLVTDRGGMVGGIYSVVMPRSYVCMPFMNTDPAKLVDSKLRNARERVKTIASCIAARQNTVDLTLGPCPGFLSRVVYPWFFSSLMKTTKFHTSNSCSGCGICAKICPNHNIQRDANGKPIWNKNCTWCLRCYHSCPSHSIAYWCFTNKKRQYLHPDYKSVITFSEK